MKFLIFKTDIKTVSKLQTIKNLFTEHFHELTWNIDTEDIDNVLRIETNGNLAESEIITLVQSQGLVCEEL